MKNFREIVSYLIVVVKQTIAETLFIMYIDLRTLRPKCLFPHQVLPQSPTHCSYPLTLPKLIRIRIRWPSVPGLSVPFLLFGVDKILHRDPVDTHTLSDVYFSRNNPSHCGDSFMNRTMVHCWRCVYGSTIR